MEEIDRILSLLQSEDPHQRHSAFDSLPAELPSQVTLALIDTLRDDNLTLRQKSIDVLVQKGPSSLSPLIEALRINNHDIKFNVIKVLGAIGDRRATAHLIDLAEHAPESLQYEIIEALVYLKDPQAIDTLITTLGHKEPGIRDVAAKGLVNLGAASLPALCTALKSPQWLTRSYAAKILGFMKDKGALRALLQALTHSDSTFTMQVIRALGELGDREAVPALLQTLSQGEQEALQPTIEALAKIQDSRSVPAMIEALKKEEWNKHEYIVNCIVSMGPEILETVCTAIRDSNPRIRIGVAKILGHFKEEYVVAPLITLSTDSDKEVRRISAHSLAQHRNEESIKALVELLADHSSGVSSEAATSIIQLAPHSRQPLIDGLCHTNPKIRGRAATLLSRKDVHQGAATPFELPHRIVPFLMDTLDKEPDYTKFVANILKHIKGNNLARRIGLIYQGHPLLSTFLEQLHHLKHWEHLSLLAKDLDKLSSRFDQRAIKSIVNALKETAKTQRRMIKDGYCLQHYARFTPQKNSQIDYLGCRECQSTIFGIQAPVVYLYLNRTMARDVDILADQINVNRLSVDQEAIDFDHIYIGACDNDEIRSLCIEIGNDTDPYRKKAYESATCTISNAATIDDEMVNLLSHHFREVRYAQ